MRLRTCGLALTGAVLGSSSAAPAQLPPNNFRLLAHIDRFPGANQPNNNYAGCWGFVGNNGKEYAVVGARQGTLIYDCSIPTAPVERAMIAGPGATSTPYFWREAQSYGNYVYMSSEHGAMQVINVTNPDAPTLAGTFGVRSHSLSVDPGTGMLWANGGSNPGGGTRAYNLLASPTLPPVVATYSAAYVHDCLPLRGYNYLAQINAGTMRILDISALPALPILSTTTTINAFTHNVWVTDDDRIAVTCDETLNPPGSLTIYDVSNKSAPILRSTWSSPNLAVVHNVFIKSQVAVFSSYSDGGWAIDISNPASPQPIGQFDTTALTGTGYYGCWGAYPFQPSGQIYLSDMQSGFWIVEPTCGVPKFYGQSTAGTGGLRPTIDYTGGFARVNNPTFAITGSKMLPSTAAILALGFGRGATNVLGIEFAISLSSPLFLLTTTTTATGTASTTIGIPNDVSLAGGGLNCQWLVLDNGAPQGLAASGGFEVAVCR
jgi:choice-of-anchor B domain-containing protein